MLEFGDIVTLENNKRYLIASTCVYNSKFYVYMVNIKNSADCMLAVLNNDDLEQVTDSEVFIQVMPLILDNAADDILNFNGEETNE